MAVKKEIILEMRGINKRFAGVDALVDVNLSVRKGDIHAICGENGAGKSTLMKILNGIYQVDSGEIWIKGQKRKISSPEQAQMSGLSIIFQEFNLVDTLSIAENIFLGRLTGSNKKIDWKDIHSRAQELLDYIGCTVKTKMLVGDISVSQKQMVEIAKALSYNAEIIVMDEPSATLTDKESENLYRIIRELKEKHITIIYISHKMDEILRISDRITILRDGRLISTCDVSQTSKNEIISQMVGRSIDQEFPARDSAAQDEFALRVNNIERLDVLHDVSLTLRKGEILGLAGLVGAGRTELVRAIFGADKVNRKTVEVGGRQMNIRKPADAIRNKIALLTEDRKQQGLILNFPVYKNISICALRDFVRLGFLRFKKEYGVASEYIDKFAIKTPSIHQKCVYLSGGNQQKVVLAKWLYCDVDILILDEPTRGIDVGSKQEIYHMMNELVAKGKSIIMISSEMPEILGMSDRILVMHKGVIKGEFENDARQVTPEQIMHCAIG